MKRNTMAYSVFHKMSDETVQARGDKGIIPSLKKIFPGTYKSALGVKCYSLVSYTRSPC